MSQACQHCMRLQVNHKTCSGSAKSRRIEPADYSLSGDSGGFTDGCASMRLKTLHDPPGSSTPFMTANLLSMAHIIESS